MKTVRKIQLIALLFFVYQSLSFCQSKSDSSTSHPNKAKQKYSAYRSEYTLREADSLVLKSDYSKAVWFYINLYPKYPKESVKRICNLKSKVKDIDEFVKTSFSNFGMSDPDILDTSSGLLKVDNEKIKMKADWMKSILKEIKQCSIQILDGSPTERPKESSISTYNTGKILIRLIDDDEDSYYIGQKDILNNRFVEMVPEKPGYESSGRYKILFERKEISRSYRDSIASLKAQPYLQETSNSQLYTKISSSKSLTLATDGQSLIDFSKGTIEYLPIRIVSSFVNHVSWSDDNQYLFAPTRVYPGASEFHIINTKENVSVAKKKIDELIEDVEFSPDSKQIALLCATGKVRHKYPWDYFASFIGHPISLITFHLRIFDLTGTEIFNHKVGTSIPNGSGQLIWIKDKD